MARAVYAGFVRAAYRARDSSVGSGPKSKARPYWLGSDSCVRKEKTIIRRKKKEKKTQ